MAAEASRSRTMSAGAPPQRLSRRARGRLLSALTHLALLAGLAIIFVPLGWMISTSLKARGDIFLLPPVVVPVPVHWENYPNALTYVPFDRFFLNSALITSLDIVGKVVSCSLVAFGFARLRFWGRDFLFLVMLSTLMLPTQVTLIPQFVVFRSFGWINTFLPLIIPNFFGGPFMTFLLRQFFLTIPLEMDDAARIDGASTFQIYYRIMLPLAKPALAAVSIFTFQNTWNEFFGPLIYLQTQDKFTIQVGLRFFQAEHGVEWHLLMAASLVAILPVVTVFFVAQRYFIQGVVFTGVKG